MNKTYWKYKELGLCRRCGAVPLPGKIRCEKCHLEHLGYQSKFKTDAIENGFCRNCATAKRLEHSTMCERCQKAHRQRGVKNYASLRQECLDAYGGRCNCCGTTVQKYLQLDHVANDGAAHRRELRGSEKQGRSAGSLYKWAKANQFPQRLQLMCANCHQAKSFFGGCSPEDHDLHQERRHADFIQVSEDLPPSLEFRLDE